MSNTEKTPPAYRIYSVLKDGSEFGMWQEIGSAWHNKDGKGLNLYFNARPLREAQIVLRVPKPKTETQPKGKASRRAPGNSSELSFAQGDGAQ